MRSKPGGENALSSSSRFQFRHGAIKTTRARNITLSRARFQFRHGAIKTGVRAYSSMPRSRFNSDTVRSKRKQLAELWRFPDVSIPTRCDQNGNGRNTLSGTTLEFQFRHGAIKTKCFRQRRSVLCRVSIPTRCDQNYSLLPYFLHKPVVSIPTRCDQNHVRPSIFYFQTKVSIPTRCDQNEAPPDPVTIIILVSIPTRCDQNRLKLLLLLALRKRFNSDTVRSKP